MEFCDNKELVSTRTFIGTLIGQNLLNIKIVFYDLGNGIFHDKTGYFRDNKNNHLTFTVRQTKAEWHFQVMEILSD